MDQCSVYVGNLDWSVDLEELCGVMKQAGKISDAQIPRRKNGLSKGYAIVEYADEESAHIAVTELKNACIGSRKSFIRLDRGSRSPEIEISDTLPCTPSNEELLAESVHSRDRSRRMQKSRTPQMRTPKEGLLGSSQNENDPESPHKPLRRRRKQSFDSAEISRAVYVANIPRRTTKDVIRSQFGEYGTIEKLFIWGYNPSGSRKSASILYSTTEEALEAISRGTETVINGKPITVKMEKTSVEIKQKKQEMKNLKRHPKHSDSSVSAVVDDIETEHVE